MGSHAIARAGLRSWLRPTRLGPSLVLLGALGVGAVEALHWRAARNPATFGAEDPQARTEALIVLGYPSTRRGTIHPVQRWRCDIALRSLHPGRSPIVVFTGGARKHGSSEAAAMATHARDVLGLSAEIRLEDRSMTTWENIAFALPMVADADVIKIVSDPLHAARARTYVRAQQPDLATRLVAVDNYRPFERWWIKAGGVAYAANLTVLRALRPPPSVLTTRRVGSASDAEGATASENP